ncbi:MAG TPA: GAF domain-containing protein, partial [Chloroflexota bacterium]|nr:GAF domain-containing protein [Chloroflexota bacterium]
METTTLPATGTAPQETFAFCQWLLSENGPDGDIEVVAGDTDHPRWHRLLRQASNDGFSLMLRAVRREAAILADRAIVSPGDGHEGDQNDLLPDAVGRAATRLSALTISALPGSQELRALRSVKRRILSELVAGYLEVTHPTGETEQRLTAKVAELAALQKINAAVNSSLDLSYVLSQTVDVVAEVMRADVTTIFLYEDSGRLVLRATRGLNPAAVGHTSLALGEGIAGWTAEYGRPVALADAWRDRRFAYVPSLMEEPYHGYLSVPIILFRANEATNKLVGVLTIQTRDIKEFSPEDIAFAETVAGQIAIAIENARLYGLTDERLQEKVQQLQALKRVTESLVSSLDVHQVLSVMARQAAMITGTDMAGIFELDEERQLLKIVAHHNLSEAYQKVAVKVGEGAVGLAVSERRAIVILDAQQDPRLQRSSAARWVAEEGYRSMFSVPLISRNRVLGGISVYTRDRLEFSRDQIEILFTFANDATIAMENARLYEEMRRSAEMKSTLLMEMHHRVKNNLQMMASLLRLQARRTQNKEAAQVLAVTHAQIQSLSAAHDLLSKESFGQTTVSEIARRVADIAVADLLPREKRIVVETDRANVPVGTGGGGGPVGSSSATLLALILNELICNAILHGLEDRETGRVVVTARELPGPDPSGPAGPDVPDGPAGGSGIEVEVADDGAG